VAGVVAPLAALVASQAPAPFPHASISPICGAKISGSASCARPGEQRGVARMPRSLRSLAARAGRSTPPTRCRADSFGSPFRA